MFVYIGGRGMPGQDIIVRDFKLKLFACGRGQSLDSFDDLLLALLPVGAPC